ncbi:MAG TPA: hypothetical protein VF717_07450 [Pyrinomonadaceae bacterium]|jgi:hypothetical protein
MYNVLVIYCGDQYPVRATIKDHLYSFQRYSKQRVFYLNLSVRSVPWYFRFMRFDLIIFHTIFLSTRWTAGYFEKMLRKARPLKALDAVKVALPQDEFLHTDVVCDFINEFGVSHVFSVALPSEWPKIYHSVDRERVKFTTVLTGYLEDGTIARINALARTAGRRVIDIGYRAYKAAPWLGRHGFLKTQIADVFQERVRRTALKADISTRAEDTFLGDAWYEFLLRCKYTLGVEGGASILDRNGAVRKRTEEYLTSRPQADFDEVESACFPGLDGKLSFFPLSPRHLEACATRTCQVLVEGEYNHILTAGEHYIELKRDFSNIDQVLDDIKRDDLRQGITDRAYRDIVESGKYTYRSFVEQVIAQSLSAAPDALPEGRRENPLISGWMRVADRLSWVVVMLRWYAVIRMKQKVRGWLVARYSEQTVSSWLRRLRGQPET